MVANRMVQLDHITRGRVMMGVGPGALVSDAYMLGIDHDTQRPRMDESLGIIMRLLTETEPITYEADWFTLREAMIHLRPYTQPHFPIAVAASQSPTGMIVAGKHGAAVLSVSVLRGGSISTNLRDFWKIGEETAAKHGNTLDRNEWRLVMPVHIAESRKEAIEQARSGAARFQRDYFENTMGFESVFDGPAEGIIDEMVENKAWCGGHAGRPGRGHREAGRGQRRLRRPPRPGHRMGNPRAGAPQLRADRAVRHARVPGFAGEPRGVPALGLRQQARPDGPPDQVDHPGGQGVRAGPVARYSIRPSTNFWSDLSTLGGSMCIPYSAQETSAT